MNADVFVDTNILLYTIDEDAAAASKRQRSQQLLLTGKIRGDAARFVHNITLTTSCVPFFFLMSQEPEASTLIKSQSSLFSLNYTPQRATIPTHCGRLLLSVF